MKIPAQILAASLSVFLFFYSSFYAGIQQGKRQSIEGSQYLHIKPMNIEVFINTNDTWLGESGHWYGPNTNDLFRLGNGLTMVADLQSHGSYQIGNSSNSHVYIFTEHYPYEAYFMDSNKNLFLMVPTTNPVTVRGISK